MKRALTILVGVIALISVQAQAPEGINYQAVARDGNGDLITSTALSVRITILSGAGASTQEYQETHAVTTNAYGLFTLIVGKGAPVTGTFAGISWGSSPHHLQVEINDGSGFVNMGTAQMMSVPYALYAETSGSGTSLTAGSGISISGNAIVNTAPDQTVALTGTGATSVTGTYPNFAINSTDNNTTYTAGTGMSLSGTTFNAQTTTALWNANQLQGRNVAATAPTSNQVLGWDGSQWAPQTFSGSSPWTVSGADVYRSSGKVGIGTSTPTVNFNVTGNTMLLGDVSNWGVSISGNDHVGSYFNSTGGSTSGEYYSGIRSIIQGADGYNYAISGVSNGNNAQGNRGVYGYATNSVSNRGVHGVAESATGTNQGVFGYGGGTTSGGNYGLYGYSTNSTTINHGAYAKADGVANERNYGVVGIVEGVGTFVNYGVYGQSFVQTTASNYGVFGYGIGSTNSNYGVYGSVDNSAPNTYSIYSNNSVAPGHYAAYFNGNVAYTGTLTNVSDRRLKKDIIPFSNGLAKLKQLNIYTYHYNPEGEYANLNLAREKQYGFLAQDVEQLFPELVYDNQVPEKRIEGKDGEVEIIRSEARYKSVNQIGMIPILVKSIQEQQEIIDNQQKTIDQQQKVANDQQQMINQLEKRISALENK